MSARRWLYPLILAAAIVVAYWRSFEGVFVFDDIEAIPENTTIRDLSKLGAVLRPPFEAGQTVGGRPLVNLTLAANYAAGGLDPWGYHAVNLGIHIGAALLLYGVVRRTIARPHGSHGTYEMGDAIGFGAALLWALHPLQTESVTYVIQRAESLMGLLYLLTLYGFVRATESGERPTPNAQHPTPNGRCEKRWLVLSAVACALGMATKEVMVSAPVIVLCFDRVFVSGSFGQALRRRKVYYAGLAASWLLLGGLVLSTKNRGGSMGMGLEDVGWWEYALTQFPAILHYVRLAVWPSPLIFDYAAEWVTRPWSVAPAAALVMTLAIASCWPVLRPKGTSPGALRAGFLGVFFFAILAPTSLVPANRQTISEHRMYLALAPLAVAAAIGVGWAVRRSGSRAGASLRRAYGWQVAIAGAIGIALGFATWQRQAVYFSEMALWRDTVAKRPGNAHAHGYLGMGLALAGRPAEAKAELLRAVEIRPDLPDAHGNLGNILMAEGDMAGALEHYETALRLRPQLPVVHFNLGAAYMQAGRVDEGVAQYREAIRLAPAYQRAHFNLGNALAGNSHGERAVMDEAVAEFTAAVRLKEDDEAARTNLIISLSLLGRTEDAIAQATAGAQRLPSSSTMISVLGSTLASGGRFGEARAAFERAVSLDPTNAQAQQNLARINSMQGAPRP